MSSSSSSSSYSSSFNIQQILLLAWIVLMVAVTGDVSATSYDKYDPGFGIYDDGFSNDNGGYDVNLGYYHHRMGQANNYAIKHSANYRNRDAVGPIHPSANSRATTAKRVVVYGRVPQMPGQYHSMGFY